MIRLKNVTINKYKCIETEQSFDVQDDVTVLVGKNESGKTAILEALEKSNSYRGEQFDIMQDYPRKWVKRFQRQQDDVTVINCTYTLHDSLVKQIQEDIGPQAFKNTEISCARSYRVSQHAYLNLHVNISDFFEYKLGQHAFDDEAFETETKKAESLEDFNRLREHFQSESQREFLERIQAYFQSGQELDSSLRDYVVRKWIEPHLPKFLYYDEYYALPSDIDIRQMQSSNSERNELKTSKALFELADINVEELIQGNNYEAYKAELEATGNEITETVFEYWKTNRNLHVQFDIERPPSNANSPILKIRVYNTKYRITLSLGSRSRGFNWFFSFLVWFSKIQEDKNNQYILLLDEPGLNLHASAQKDLLRFIEDLATSTEFSRNFQLLYTTHSAAMIESNKLQRVRTVFESDEGTRISDAATETDPDTLIPLYGALGYDIAQNLFISTNNLLVEGTSDLIYLTVMSALLEGKNRTSLRDDIAIVPVGGADKVATFIALIRGQELNIACLLDSFIEYPKQQRVDDLIDYRVIHKRNVRYFHEFAGNGREADIEDMFEKDEYLILYNEALTHNLKVEELDPSLNRIVEQIRKEHGKFRAHYRVARQLAAPEQDISFIGEGTLARFEQMFKAINVLYEE